MQINKKAMEEYPSLAGASCLTRTGDTLINSQVLYPTELKRHISDCEKYYTAVTALLQALFAKNAE